MKFVSAARKRMLGIRSENLKLHKKLEEIRTINRSKVLTYAVSWLYRTAGS